MSHSTLSE